MGMQPRLLLLLFLQLPAALCSQEMTLSAAAANYTTEEGSGEEGSGEQLVALLQQEDAAALSLASSPRPRFQSLVEKRAADRTASGLGQLPPNLVPSITFFPNLRVPPGATLALGRQLNTPRGPRAEYVALLTEKPPRWGRLYVDDNGQLHAEFVKGSKFVQVAPNQRIRVLAVPPDSASAYDLALEWVQASKADLLAIIVMTSVRGQYSKVTSGVYSDGRFEFLGEANLDTQQFFYVYNGDVHVVDGQEFLNKVSVLTKRSCSCSCPGKSFFSNIGDFFG